MRSLLLLSASLLAAESHQATGVRVGEVTPTSAIVWMRVTARPTRAPDGAAPGMAGQVRLRYSDREDMQDARMTDWIEVGPSRDYSHQFRLEGLRPATRYYYIAETTGRDGSQFHDSLKGGFGTAPLPARRAAVRFTVITGQAYKDLDHAGGFHIYPAMKALDPDFIVPTGDNVYYDNDPPLANTPALARLHWERMYSLPRMVAFFLQVPAYWEKDDHDTLHDDCWPAMAPPKMLPMTFAQGQKIFLEQVPMGTLTYRRARWGKGLEVWLTEGRDFRSPNRDPDGPSKTIWGAEQKAWLKKSLLASDADWKVLVSPTPVVGPDRANKGDNHANAAFAHEGNEFRGWAAKNLKNFFVACGDRHWQYHSVDPKTGLQEFSSGPASDQHAGGSPGLNPEYHKFHRVKGGFLEVSVEPAGQVSRIRFRLRDVNGQAVYDYVR